MADPDQATFDAAKDHAYGTRGRRERADFRPPSAFTAPSLGGSRPPAKPEFSCASSGAGKWWGDYRRGAVVERQHEGRLLAAS